MFDLSLGKQNTDNSWLTQELDDILGHFIFAELCIIAKISTISKKSRQKTKKN